MFIQTESTPNPATVKFIPGQPVAAVESIDFADAEAAAARSPLAARLFAVAGVERVFLGPDFISVTKAADQDWAFLKPPVLAVVMEHFAAALPVLTAEAGGVDAEVAATGAAAAAGAALDPLSAQIKELLETRVRPAVARDGGDIVFQGFDDGVVYVSMRGACSGCPSSTATLKMGVENMLRHYVPEVREVRATG